MSLDYKQLVSALTEQLARDLETWLYVIRSETELCHLFFAVLLAKAHGGLFPPDRVRAEVPVERGGRIDIALRGGTSGWALFLEAKVRIRERGMTAYSRYNQPLRQSQAALEDSARLHRLRSKGFCYNAALLLYERGSYHLKDRVLQYLIKESIPFDEEWNAITRPAQLPQRPQIEHLGLIWIDLPPKAA